MKLEAKLARESRDLTRDVNQGRAGAGHRSGVVREQRDSVVAQPAHQQIPAFARQRDAGPLERIASQQRINRVRLFVPACQQAHEDVLRRRTETHRIHLAMVERRRGVQGQLVDRAARHFPHLLREPYASEITPRLRDLGGEHRRVAATDDQMTKQDSSCSKLPCDVPSSVSVASVAER